MKYFLLTLLFIFSNFTVTHVVFAAPAPLEEKIDRIDKALSQEFEKGEFSGNILVAQDSKSVYQKSFGFSDVKLQKKLNAENLFVVGSVSKQFFGVLALILQREKLISLQDPIGKYLPFLDAPRAEIKIHELLSHSSGLLDMNYEADDFPKDEYKKIDFEHNKEAALTFYFKVAHYDEKKEFHYNNYGFTVLSYIFEKVTQKSVEDLVTEKIFIPLEMTDSGFCKHSAFDQEKNTLGYNHGVFVTDINIKEYSWDGWKGSDGIFSSLSDLNKWFIALNENKILSSEEAKEFFAPRSYDLTKKSDYGYGISLQFNEAHQLTHYFHGGGTYGFMSFVGYNVKEKATYILLMNETMGWSSNAYRAVGSVIREP